MATKYVWSAASGSASGDDWTNAYTTIAAGLAALSAAGDVLKVHKTHSETFATDTTLTFQNSISVICVDKDASDAPDVGAVVGGSANNYFLTLACSGERKIFIHGITFSLGTGASSRVIYLFSSDQAHVELSSVGIILNGGASSRPQIGFGSASGNHYLRWSGSIKFGATTQYIDIGTGRFDFTGLTVDGAGSAPAKLFGNIGSSGVVAFAEGCDFSHNGSGNLIVNAVSNGHAAFTLSNCKVGTGAFLEAQTTVTNKGGTTLTMFNCANADAHYVLYHEDPLGKTEISTSIYANDGASYDGTNRCSFKITSTSAASFFTPYVSPWIEQYNADTSTSITPYLEGLRDGSATVIQDDEVWAEFSRQGTSGSPLAVFSNDRMALLGTPANQTSTLGASDWTGEAGTFSTFKLQAPAAFTPAEIGPLKARVIVGEPGLTIYVDPQIRT